MRKVDLNADLGEGFGVWQLGDDDGLLQVITSANIACGFHAGDPNIMRRVCEAAASRGVAIGAQVSYNDRPGFGRRFIEMDPIDLENDVIYQIGGLDAFARAAGSSVTYVKPHGALYHAVTDREDQAAAVARAVALLNERMAIVCMSGSSMEAAANSLGLPTIAEAYADRAYEDSGRLRSRRLDGALLTNVDEVVAQAQSIVLRESVATASGGQLAMKGQSLCLHGDTPGAVQLAKSVREALEKAGVHVAPFAPSGVG